MDGLDRIIEKIISDAEADAASAIERADKQAAEILAAAREHSDAAAASALKEAAERAEALRSLADGSAKLDAGKTVLACKHSLIDRAFELAKEKLSSLDDESYLRLLADYAKVASPECRGELILSGKDRERIGKTLAERTGIALSEQTADIGGGFIHRDGSVETDCSLNAIIASCRNELSDAVAKVLFK